MAVRRSPCLGVVVGTIAAVVPVGTGADAFRPARSGSLVPFEPAAAGITGESAPPGPARR
jgi:hypothetical protein